MFVNHSSNECSKKEVVDIDKKFGGQKPPDMYPRQKTPKPKPARTYHRLFETLKEHQNALAPQIVMVDFELAVLNAIDSSFPDSSKKGCFFHFNQAIFRKI